MIGLNITGDLHGGQSSMHVTSKYFRGDAGEINLCAGDLAAVHYHDYETNLAHKKNEDGFRNMTLRKKFLWVAADGNHDNLRRLFGGEFPLVEFFGGRAYRIEDHIYYLKRGDVFTFSGKTLLAFGGAQSHDRHAFVGYDAYGRRKKYKARVEGVDWWPEEVPSEEDYENACRNLDKVGWKVDYVLSHTCPSSQSTLFPPYKAEADWQPPGDPTEEMLQRIADRLEFKSWHFGHRHLEKKVGKYVCHYTRVRSLDACSQAENYEVEVW